MRPLLILCLAGAAFGQFAPPNDMGVTMAHVHLTSADFAAQNKFWIDILGAKPLSKPWNGVTMPGSLILYSAGTPSGPSEGSAINHVGVFEPELEAYAAKLDAAQIKYVRQPNGKQLMIQGPEGVKVEITADPAKKHLEFHHVHYYTADPKAIQAWYAKHFGAVPGTRAIWDAGDIPGANLTFAQSDTSKPTAGRAVDHIGFEVRNLEAFCQKLQAAGVKIATPYRSVPKLGIALAFLTDPWGTRLELTEGLAKAANLE